VKKRDKRVIELELKEKQEEQKKATQAKEAAAQAAQVQRSQRQQFLAEEARRLAEQARIRREIYGEIDEEESAAALANSKQQVELMCAVCNKKFKSEKQYANHEASKKHKEAVKREQELIQNMKEEEEEEDSEEESDESQSSSDSDSELESAAEATGDDYMDEFACAACKQRFTSEEECFKHLESDNTHTHTDTTGDGVICWLHFSPLI
jgi:DnaJ family protein A protein 5